MLSFSNKSFGSSAIDRIETYDSTIHIKPGDVQNQLYWFYTDQTSWLVDWSKLSFDWSTLSFDL